MTSVLSVAREARRGRRLESARPCYTYNAHVPIFTRRTLQRLINENRSFLRPEQVQRQVNVLNDSDPAQDWIATEWEIVVLNTFARLGLVIHEPALKGPAKPDMYFTPAAGGTPIAIDITTVSDRGLEKENPYELLSQELMKRTRKLAKKGVGGSFTLEVGACSLNVFRGSEPTRLKLPRPARFDDGIFNEGFKDFLSRVVAQPRAAHRYEIKNSTTDVTIIYSPRRTGVGGSYAYFKAAHSKRRNPVANALFNKADQLKRTGLTCPSGIVLCDGGCDMLTHFTDWSSYSLREVVDEFFRQKPRIGFVLILHFKSESRFSMGQLPAHIEGQLYLNDAAPPLGSDLCECLRKVVGHCPKPSKNARNARNYFEWQRRAGLWNEGDSLFGGLCMSDHKITISARTVLELLAGRLDYAKFSMGYGLGRSNPFLRNLREGRLIVSAMIERSEFPEDDDELLTLEFGEPDPAVSPFKITSTEPSQT